MVVMMMVVTVVDYNHNLRLRRVGCREAENEDQCQQNLLHDSVSRA